MNDLLNNTGINLDEMNDKQVFITVNNYHPAASSYYQTTASVVKYTVGALLVAATAYYGYKNAEAIAATARYVYEEAKSIGDTACYVYETAKTTMATAYCYYKTVKNFSCNDVLNAGINIIGTRANDCLAALGNLNIINFGVDHEGNPVGPSWVGALGHELLDIFMLTDLQNLYTALSYNITGAGADDPVLVLEDQLFALSDGLSDLLSLWFS